MADRRVEALPSEESLPSTSAHLQRETGAATPSHNDAAIGIAHEETSLPPDSNTSSSEHRPNHSFGWIQTEMRQKGPMEALLMNPAEVVCRHVNGSIGEEAALNVDTIRGNNVVLAEQLELANSQLNRALCARMELQEELNNLRRQHECTLRDYEETMMERSTVLEENNRLAEERDRLRDSVRHLSNTLHNMINSKTEHQIQQLQSKLEHTRRLLQLNMEETACANSRREEARQEMGRMRLVCDALEKERDEALFQLSNLDERDEEPMFDCWETHAIQIALPSPSTNLGVMLGGGKGDEMFSSGMPIFVRDLVPGCPFDGHLKPLDYILYVNDIDVSSMDQRSVVDILSNSCNLKMVVKRRSAGCRITEFAFNDITDLGAEFEDGVFISKLDENGSGAESGLTAGARIIHVNGIPVYDVMHTRALIDARKENIVLGVIPTRAHVSQRQTNKQTTATVPHQNKQRSRFLNKVHDKLFGRFTNEKSRAIIAHANLDACAGELTSFRHGSLRIPSSRVSSLNNELVRTGSLRTTSHSSDQRHINEQLDKFLHRQSQSHDEDGSVRTWPKSREPIATEDLQSKRKAVTRPSVLPVFPSASSYRSGVNAATVAHSDVVAHSARYSMQGATRPTSWYPSTPLSVCGASARIVTSTNLLTQPKAVGIAHAQRVSTRSPALPQPPPYPGPRSSIDSLSVASSNSYPLPPSSSTSYNRSFSPNGTILNGSDSQLLEEDEDVRRVVVTRDGGGGFGLVLDNGNGGVIISNVYGSARGRVHVGEQLLDVCGINMRSADRLAATRVLKQFCASHDEVTLLVRRRSETPRWLRVPRRSIRLCGGNAIGILVEIPVGELNMGERILEIDGKDVREATLEEATRELENGRSEMVDVVTEYDGGERLKRLKKGADGDSFYMRVNIDRNGENGDELDIKKGEIVYVDNTLFMGVSGRWRAWRVDHEGRQRQCGIIPSQWRIEEEETSRQRRAKGRIGEPRVQRHIYERVERVASSQRRPLVLLSAYVAPFMQALIDEHSDKFAQCVPECRALNASEGERVTASGQWIEVRRREELFEVISVSALQHMIAQGYHCVLDVTPHAIVRLHSLRIYPIVIRIKFKSAKQLKELAEESGNERVSSKAAREMLERADAIDLQLDALECAVSTIGVGTHRARNAVKYMCQQIVAIVEHEQKRTVWAPAIKQSTNNPIFSS
uniref:Disks large 5 n=2 Tax=Ascaris suum TaxID=6253 RepID=F1KRB5_ASCSU